MPDIIGYLGQLREKIVIFVTEESGIFAATLAVLSVITLAAGIIVPILRARREKKESKAYLSVAGLHLSELSRSSSSFELRFEAVNTGCTAALLLSVKLRVLEQTSSAEIVPTYTEASLRVSQHRVLLKPGLKSYDVRARTYGPSCEPIQLTETEIQPFLVKLVANEPHEYTLQVELDWYDAKDPSVQHTSHSQPFVVNFPLRVPSGLPPELVGAAAED